MRVTSASTTILLVEDDQTIRELAAAMLAADGYRVLSAATAQEALAVLERHPDVALIFSDVQMPRWRNWRTMLKPSQRGICTSLKINATSGCRSSTASASCAV
ncbi:response regulator, partial [Xanthomonas sp. LMG 12462]|uniref:response regulator n=1 Tax=Xanthomonas sp. LMG 12462 TaxID=1591134 RepID=UPI001D037C19